MLAQTKRLKGTSSKFLPDSPYILPLCFVALTGLTLLNFLLIFFLSFRINQLATRGRTFVQTLGGEAIEAREKEATYRYPEVIKNAVRRWATLTFDWDGKVLGGESDGGYQIGRKKITTNAYFASFLIQSGKAGFRQKFLELLGNITPPDVFSGKLRSKLNIAFISEPRQTRLGEWEVDLISTRILLYAGGKEEEIDLNRTMTLRAVDIPNPPSSEASPLDLRVYDLQMAGLQIISMTEFKER
jgi:hypothetical protein